MVDQKLFSEIQSYKLKFSVLQTCVFICFSLIALKLWFLQIHHGTNFKNFSNRNRFKKEILLAPRGLLLDRTNQILAGNKTIVELKINLSYVKDLERTLQKISHIIGWPVQKIQLKIEQQKKQYGFFHSVTIKRNLTLEEIYKLKLLYWEISGVYVQESIVRTYPLKDNASQVIGFVGRISKKELDALKRNNNSAFQEEIIGKSGLEKMYNSNLKGSHGLSLIEVDAHNRIVEKTKSPFYLQSRKSIQGENVKLTLDKDIQEAALKAMRRNDSLGPRQGSVIVMKTNGEILAWLSEPGFDSNLFSKELDETLWEQSTQSSSKKFLNKGLQEHYSPGSTLKPFIALAALQEGIINKDTTIHSKGTFKLGQSVFHESTRKGYGSINVIQAIERSSNIFFYQTGLDLGINKMAKYLKLFGLGSQTNVDLYGEVSGFIPTKKWKKDKIGVRWQKGETVLTAIGQGYITATLLQLAVAYNAIATEGLIVKPFLNKKNKPQILDTLIDRIDRKHFKTIKKGLESVVTGQKGTARWWQNLKFSFAGKTGTSQVIALSSKNIYNRCSLLPLEKRHHGLFISFAPIDKPEVVVAVLTEHSCSGSIGSVPVARDIIKSYLKKYPLKKRAEHVSF